MQRSSEAIRRGLRYLSRRQSADGAWRDFQLCGCASDAWVTAYVTATVSQFESFAEHLHRARGFLERSVRDGGWGFNDEAPVDADSTSWALLAIERDAPAARVGLEGLLRHQRHDGGFTCFVEFTDQSAWQESHDDISAVALRALLRAGDARNADRCARYLRAKQRQDGAWQAFWYNGPEYATLHAVSALFAYDGNVPNLQLLPVPSHDPFASAQAIELESRFSGIVPIDRIAALLDLQHRDGRWTAGNPFMRPNPWNHAPEDADIAVRDQFGIFTTATVLRALGAAS